MPIHFAGKKFEHWRQAAAAVKREHPDWSAERVDRYVGGIEKKQKKGVKFAGKRGADRTDRRPADVRAESDY